MALLVLAGACRDFSAADDFDGSSDEDENLGGSSNQDASAPDGGNPTSSDGNGGHPANTSSGGQSPTSAGGASGGAGGSIDNLGGVPEFGEVCGKEGVKIYELLDDFEDGDLSLSEEGGRTGEWSAKSSEMGFSLLVETDLLDAQNKALHFEHSFDSTITGSFLEGNGFYDISAYRALEFRVRGPVFGSNDLIFKLATHATTTDYYAGGHTMFPSWHTVTFCFVHEDPDPEDKYQLKQQGWGGVDEDLLLDLARSMQFFTNNPDPVDLWIDDVRLVGLRD